MSKEQQMSQETFHQLGADIREVAIEQQTLREPQPKPDAPYLDTIGVSPHTTRIDSVEVDGSNAAVDSTLDTYVEEGDLKVANIHTKITSKVKTVAGDYKTETASGVVAHKVDKEYVPRTTVTRVANGEKVTREIKNPKAAELVTRLAIKKAKQIDEQEPEAA